MTEYELVSLYHEAITVFFTAVTTLLSLIFAYLVAMFFIAHRLGIALFWILNGLFAAVCFGVSGGLLANGRRAAVIAIEIRNRASLPGSSIDFLDAEFFIPPDMPMAMTGFVWFATLLSMTYAVLHRRAQRAAKNAGRSPIG